MWATGALFAAENPPPTSGISDTLIVTIGGIVVAALGTLGLVLSEVVKGRHARTTASPPPPSLTSQSMDVELYERTAVLSQRADDNDERDALQDRELRDQRDALDDHHHRLLRLERRDDDGRT